MRMPPAATSCLFTSCSAALVRGSVVRGNIILGSTYAAIAIEHGGETLLVDVGFSAREIRRRADAAAVPLDRVVGIALTHEHGDHTAGARARGPSRSSNW